MANVLEDRDERILEAAILLAKRDGYQWITREDVANGAQVALGSVNNAYGTMRDLKRRVLQTAVDRRIVEIVAQGLADRHEIALSAPEELKKAAALHLTY